MFSLPALANTILISPLNFVLTWLYQLTGSFGLAILLFTVLMRTILLPLSLPTLQSQKKMRDLAPEIEKLKKKHGKDQKALQLAQMELYKQHNVNPLAGCIPYILQLVVIFALYSVLQHFVSVSLANGLHVNTLFFGIDLAKPDTTYILPVLAGVSQLILSLMILPGAERHDLIPEDVKGKKLKELNKEENNTQEMAQTMQKQMVFMMPIVTGWLALRFPAGLALYWVATTVYSIAQQWAVSGPGGLFDAVYQVRKRLHI